MFRSGSSMGMLLLYATILYATTTPSRRIGIVKPAPASFGGGCCNGAEVQIVTSGRGTTRPTTLARDLGLWKAG